MYASNLANVRQRQPGWWQEYPLGIGQQHRLQLWHGQASFPRCPHTPLPLATKEGVGWVANVPVTTGEILLFRRRCGPYQRQRTLVRGFAGPRQHAASASWLLRNLRAWCSAVSAPIGLFVAGWSDAGPPDGPKVCISFLTIVDSQADGSTSGPSAVFFIDGAVRPVCRGLRAGSRAFSVRLVSPWSAVPMPLVAAGACRALHRPPEPKGFRTCPARRGSFFPCFSRFSRVSRGWQSSRRPPSAAIFCCEANPESTSCTGAVR